MKTGLVLEGGAMRGMFTAGVLDVLMEHNIQLDGAIGVSAGAVFGCNYKSHQIGRTIRYNTEYCTNKRYASFGNLLRTGNLYSEQFCYHTVPEKLDPFDTKAFRDYFSSTLAPASSSFFLMSSASALEACSFSLGSAVIDQPSPPSGPEPVISLTVLMTCILVAPDFSQDDVELGLLLLSGSSSGGGSGSSSSNSRNAELLAVGVDELFQLQNGQALDRTR